MLIRHIPHSSAEIPAKYRSDYVVTDDELRYEILRLTDWYTDQLFEDNDSDGIIFPVSRLVCDPERFLDDVKEPASKVGMGVYYTHGTNGQVLRQLDSDKRREVIEALYDPHHGRLTEAVAKHVDEHGLCLILDCHSFPVLPLPTDDNAKQDRPDFCLGYTHFHSDQRLVDQIKGGLEMEGFSVTLNTPYAGSLIPLDFYQQTTSVLGLMVEVNRSLYMDESTGKKTDNFNRVQQVIRTQIIEQIKAYLRDSCCRECKRYLASCTCEVERRVWDISCPYCSSNQECSHLRGVYDASFGGYSGDLSEIISKSQTEILRELVNSVGLGECESWQREFLDQFPDETKDYIRDSLRGSESIDQIDRISEVMDSLEYEVEIDLEEIFRDWISESSFVEAVSGIDARECVEYIIYSESEKAALTDDFVLYVKSTGDR